MADVLKTEMNKEPVQSRDELPTTLQKKSNNPLLRNKERVTSEGAEIPMISRVANDSPSLRQINSSSPSQNVVILSTEMAQQNLNSNKKKKNVEQQKETPVKLQLNKKDSQKEFEYANDSFENPD
jgi:hypothetical protein